MYYHRNDRDEGIKYLAEKYPRCFAEDPAQRRPLKHDVIADLEKEGVLDREALTQVLDWYQSHFVYRYGLIAGATRVDLEGAKAGSVTPKEQSEARAWVAARKKELGWQRQGTAPVAYINENGHANGHAMTTKTTAPAAVTPPGRPRHPRTLAEMQSALTWLGAF